MRIVIGVFGRVGATGAVVAGAIRCRPGLVGALLLGGGIGAWIQLRRVRSRRSAVRS